MEKLLEYCPCGITVLIEDYSDLPRCFIHKGMPLGFWLKNPLRYTERKTIIMNCQYCKAKLKRDVSMKTRKATCEDCKRNKQKEYNKRSTNHY